MSMGRVSLNGVKERIGQLCSEFKLPTVGAEAGPRFTAAGHTDALHTLVEVLEQEAEDRRQRRIIRIRRASRLPVGKTWDTFEHDRVPVALRQQLDELADGSFVERGVKDDSLLVKGRNACAQALPATGRWTTARGHMDRHQRDQCAGEGASQLPDAETVGPAGAHHQGQLQ